MVEKDVSSVCVDVRRLFIDPASHRTGWALFEDRNLIGAGSIVALDRITVEGVPKSKWPKIRCEVRLAHLSAQYRELMLGLRAMHQQPSQVYFETFDFKPSNEVAWSVGALQAALSPYSECFAEEPTLSVKRWQRRVGWKHKEMKGATLDDAYKGLGLDKDSPLVEYLPAVDSIDCLAAVGLGLSFVWDAEFKETERVLNKKRFVR